MMYKTSPEYIRLKTLIEESKTYLLFLRQVEIDRTFLEAKPHDLTKLSIRVAKHLDFHRQYDLADNVLNTAKSVLKSDVYHNYLIHKTYCKDKLLACENELKENRAYRTTTAPSRQNNIQQPAPTQTTYSSRANDSTLMMNQAMVNQAMMNQAVTVAMINQMNEDSNHHCPNNSDSQHHTHHHDQHHTHQDDSNCGSTYTSSEPHSHNTSSHDYSSSVTETHHSHQPDYSSSVHDNSSMYHNSGSLFDHSSSHNDNSSSSHDYSSSSGHDYSSSSHDTSSYDHSSSYSM